MDKTKKPLIAEVDNISLPGYTDQYWDDSPSNKSIFAYTIRELLRPCYLINPAIMLMNIILINASYYVPVISGGLALLSLLVLYLVSRKEKKKWYNAFLNSTISGNLGIGLIGLLSLLHIITVPLYMYYIAAYIFLLGDLILGSLIENFKPTIQNRDKLRWLDLLNSSSSIGIISSIFASVIVVVFLHNHIIFFAIIQSFIAVAIHLVNMCYKRSIGYVFFPSVTSSGFIFISQLITLPLILLGFISLYTYYVIIASVLIFSYIFRLLAKFILYKKNYIEPIEQFTFDKNQDLSINNIEQTQEPNKEFIIKEVLADGNCFFNALIASSEENYWHLHSTISSFYYQYPSKNRYEFTETKRLTGTILRMYIKDQLTLLKDNESNEIWFQPVNEILSNLNLNIESVIRFLKKNKHYDSHEMDLIPLISSFILDLNITIYFDNNSERPEKYIRRALSPEITLLLYTDRLHYDLLIENKIEDPQIANFFTENPFDMESNSKNNFKSYYVENTITKGKTVLESNNVIINRFESFNCSDSSNSKQSVEKNDLLSNGDKIATLQELLQNHNPSSTNSSLNKSTSFKYDKKNSYSNKNYMDDIISSDVARNQDDKFSNEEGLKNTIVDLYNRYEPPPSNLINYLNSSLRKNLNKFQEKISNIFTSFKNIYHLLFISYYDLFTFITYINLLKNRFNIYISYNKNLQQFYRSYKSLSIVIKKLLKSIHPIVLYDLFLVNLLNYYQPFAFQRLFFFFNIGYWITLISWNKKLLKFIHPIVLYGLFLVNLLNYYRPFAFQGLFSFFNIGYLITLICWNNYLQIDNRKRTDFYNKPNQDNVPTKTNIARDILQKLRSLNQKINFYLKKIFAFLRKQLKSFFKAIKYFLTKIIKQYTYCVNKLSKKYGIASHKISSFKKTMEKKLNNSNHSEVLADNRRDEKNTVKNQIEIKNKLVEEIPDLFTNTVEKHIDEDKLLSLIHDIANAYLEEFEEDKKQYKHKRKKDKTLNLDDLKRFLDMLILIYGSSNQGYLKKTLASIFKDCYNAKKIFSRKNIFKFRNLVTNINFNKGKNIFRSKKTKKNKIKENHLPIT